MGSLDDEATTRRLVAFLLRLASRRIRNAFVGAILMLIAVAVAGIVIERVAGEDPTTQRLETKLRMALMVLAFLVPTTCVAVYIWENFRSIPDLDDRDGN